ncbi:Calcineurin-like phosphoesterase [Flaviramulus basaltis]|uniref:Calcineurin-like phosphoesterase n=1 Tax=Flaviramulus basaltis TaxID=369401 RepID=A0A1K2IAV6_9FLAO|nr:metallophosphoesterase [Flaviramulus basaltis]SFZ89541.1 Calcineurin-like phosphoesterase [Flaviramulus basaltis]
MKVYQFSPQELDTLSDINAKFDEAKTEQTQGLAENNVDDYWRYLQSCETYYTQKTFTTLGYTHDMENMLSLYIINDLIDQGYLTKAIRDFGLPKSKITTTDIEEGILDGYVAEDGTLYVLSKFCQLDPMWSAVLVYYAFYKLFPKKVHHFTTEPSKKEASNPKTKQPKTKDTITIAVLGDWGTGVWKDGHQEKCPAELVIDGIASLNPDYVIHLGDVYYAGTSKEERKHLLGLLKGKLTGELYTMNSNHEMYDGANGLYDIALKSDDFAAQGGRTYFSIDLGDWILVGLDSAYFDDSFLYMNGSLYKNKVKNEQIEFLKGIAAQNKSILLMTHHNGIGIKDHKFNLNNKLWNQVTEALGTTNKNGTLTPHLPDVWYWGHVHNGLVYNTEALKSVSGLTIPNTAQGKTPLFRCSGHASMPFGNGTGFFTEDPITKKQTMRKELDYYAHTPMTPGKHKLTDAQEKRVLNGFSMLEISKANTLTETFYEVANTYVEPKVVWRS